jgi:YfiH family protein
MRFVGASTKRTRSAIQVLKAKSLARIPWLIHGFSTRVGGASQPYGNNSLNLGFTKEDDARAVEQNRARFLHQVGAITKGELWPLVTLKQVHSSLIHHVQSVPPSLLSGDGLISATAGILIAIQTADCLPVIVVDAKQRAVGVFHAGWRGTLQRIVEKGVGEMRKQFASRPGHLQAAIGPGIHGCCYDVGAEVREKFATQFAYAADLFREVKESDVVRDKYPLLFLTARAPGHSELPSRLFLDLVEANRRQLLDAGLPSKNIEASTLCTSCRVDLLFSYRAEKGITGRMLGVAGIRA